MSRLAAVGMVLGVAAMGACGGDTIVPPTPPSEPGITIAGGNTQSANVLHLLPDPLSVFVRTPNGAGVPGVPVSWTVTQGGGTLSASGSVSDGQGRASVRWTLGSEVGNQTVAATAAGVDGSPANFSATADAPIVLHYDGTSWATALEDVSGANTSLASIWGGTGSELFAVGSFCGGNLLLRHSGTSWDLPQACAGNPGPFDVSMSVWGSSASDVFAVHRDSYPPSIRTTILHYDGQQWNPIYERECSFLSSGSSCNDFLDAVWSTSSADAFAVGGAGTIKHFDGTGWSPQASGTTNELHAVWGAAPGAVFAVGDAGSIVFYDGSAWVSQTSGTNQPLNAVSGISANDVFAVGAGGTILHYDGSSWTAQTSGTTQTLRGVWGTSANAVFAVGDGSTILRYDGTKWAAQTTTADMNLRGIWGSSATNVFAVGAPR